MAQANTYASPSDQTWYTDKARIITTNEGPITYQVNIVYGTPTAGNLYTDNIGSAVPANWIQDVWVGVGNKLTVTGNCLVQELGTTSSGQRAVR
jgi:hypothetical protein